MQHKLLKSKGLRGTFEPNLGAIARAQIYPLIVVLTGASGAPDRGGPFEGDVQPILAVRQRGSDLEPTGSVPWRMLTLALQQRLIRAHFRTLVVLQIEDLHLRAMKKRQVRLESPRYVRLPALG